MIPLKRLEAWLTKKPPTFVQLAIAPPIPLIDNPPYVLPVVRLTFGWNCCITAAFDDCAVANALQALVSLDVPLQQAEYCAKLLILAHPLAVVVPAPPLCKAKFLH